MSRLNQALTHLIEPAVTALGYELLGIEYQTRGRSAVLRLYIDKSDGITVDDCARVSYQVSGVLDVEDPIQGHYNLEVSSPGMDRPLFTPAHFRQVLGQEIKLRVFSPIQGRKKFTGVLEQVDEAGGSLLIRVDQQPVEIAFANIDKANLVPVFDF